MKKMSYSLVQVIIIVIITAFITAFTTGVLFTKSIVNNINGNYSEFVKDENIRNFLNVYEELNNRYYENVDKKELIDGAIKGMMDYLDEDYTSYLQDDKATSLVNQLNGTYNGIGVTISGRKIINIVENSPAEKSGILIGDEIIEVNGEDVTNYNNDEIAFMIKSTNTPVVTIRRGEETYTFELQIEQLSVPNVYSSYVEDSKIGYINVSVFANNVSREVERALEQVESKEVNHLIIDLRNNSGGYLEEANKIASLFLENGKVIYSLNERGTVEVVKDSDNTSRSYPITVMINEYSASASEILAAALKESYGATLVGKKTYGKGKVQHTYSLGNGGIVKYTSSTWLTPSGTCVDGVGYEPDYEVENEYIYSNDNKVLLKIIDHQLDKAIELIRNN